MSLSSIKSSPEIAAPARPDPLTTEERDVLGHLADVLIPPAANGLSASAAGVNGALLEEAERYAPDVTDRLRAVIVHAAGQDPGQALAALRADDPLGYDAFCETIAAIYFMSPAVRTSVGFTGREAKPARIDVADLEDLLMPVINAGFEPR